MSPFTVRHLLSSPAVRLIRKDHASFIISFLWRVFKEGDIFYIVYEEMLARLRSEIEDSATGDGEIAVTRSPD